MAVRLFERWKRFREAYLRRTLDLSSPQATLRTVWQLCSKNRLSLALLCFEGPTRLVIDQGFRTNPKFAWLLTWALSDIEHGGYNRVRHMVHFVERDGQWLIQDVAPSLFTQT